MALSFDADEESVYTRRLVTAITTTAFDLPVGFDTLLSRTHGAFPSEVLAIARQHDVEIEFPLDGRWYDRKPDPSPAMAEYYFTTESAKAVAANLAGNVLCLGTPTIAEALASDGRPSTLVDSSPWVHERFNLPANLVHHRAGEAVEEFAEDFAFDVAVLDPPWYFPTLTQWLSVASRCVKHGGTILPPLIPEFTRPSAASDAHQVRAAANRIGPTRDTALFAEYDSPRFERVALRRAGATIGKPWRRARILAISNASPSPEIESTPVPARWVDVRVGNSIVSV